MTTKEVTNYCIRTSIELKIFSYVLRTGLPHPNYKTYLPDINDQRACEHAAHEAYQYFQKNMLLEEGIWQASLGLFNSLMVAYCRAEYPQDFTQT